MVKDRLESHLQDDRGSLIRLLLSGQPAYDFVYFNIYHKQASPATLAVRLTYQPNSRFL